jgi:hypothetical protein
VSDALSNLSGTPLLLSAAFPLEPPGLSSLFREIWLHFNSDYVRRDNAIRHKHLVERAPIPGRPAGIGAHRRGRARCSAGVTETLSPTPAPETVRPIFSADAGARACWSPPPRRPDARPEGCSAGRAGPARYLFSGAHARAGRGCGSHPLDRARPVTCSTLVPGQVLHYNRSDGIIAGEPSAEPSRPR